MKKSLFFLAALACAAAVSARAQNATATAASSGNATPAANPTAAAASANTFIPLVGQAPNAMPANPDLPTLWLIGDSTVRNGSRGDGTNMNQWGWGAPLEYYFDLKKINVVNRALGGTSSRSYYNAQWKNVLPLLKKGDFVIMQFGANDNGDRGGMRGAGDETRDATTANGAAETVHTFGWYLKQYVKEAREKGATPIICSLTPRRRFLDDGHFRRDAGTHVAWTAEAAKASDTPYIDLYELIARKYEEVGPDVSATYFAPTTAEYLHTGWSGAVVNAELVVSGLKSLKPDPLANYFSARGQAIPAADLTKPAPEPKKPAAAPAPASATPPAAATAAAQN